MSARLGTCSRSASQATKSLSIQCEVVSSCVRRCARAQINCTTVIPGRTVVVVRSNGAAPAGLALCEVQVLGGASAPSGPAPAPGPSPSYNPTCSMMNHLIAGCDNFGPGTPGNCSAVYDGNSGTFWWVGRGHEGERGRGHVPRRMCGAGSCRGGVNWGVSLFGVSSSPSPPPPHAYTQDP
jgi:hypothetical protein